MDERISLTATIFSDDNETEMIRNLSGDDAQAFVDAIDKVMLSYFQLFDSLFTHFIFTFVQLAQLSFTRDHVFVTPFLGQTTQPLLSLHA